MPNSCAVLGCKNRQSKTLRLYRFPAICKKPKFKELSLIRRNRWLTALQRDDINEKNARVCAMHFISGASAQLKDMYNPDWVPTINMGNPLFPKRQKYSSNEERKEHAFVDLFELIGDGETNNDKSIIYDNQTSDEEKDKSQDHNYSRNLITEMSKFDSEEQDGNVNESIHSLQDIDFRHTNTDGFFNSKTYSNKIETDLDDASCGVIDDFNQIRKNYIHHQNVSPNICTKFENCHRIDEYTEIDKNYYHEPETTPKNIIIFNSEMEVGNSSNKLNQTIDYYDPKQNLTKVDLKPLYSEINLKPYNDKIDENIYDQSEQNVNESAIINQMEDNSNQIQEHNYSTNNNLYADMANRIDDENILLDNLKIVEKSNSTEISDDISDLDEEIVVFNPEPLIKDIGTQTYMSNNMFEYLVTEIAKKNLIIQQKDSIITEKDKKIGKLKVKLHNIRMEIYNSEVKRRRGISSHTQ